MMDFSLHPNVYATGEPKSLVHMLERVWVRDQKPGDGTMYVISGFGNHNGAVRFLETFNHHVKAGGKVVSVFAGSTAQQLTSRQLVEAMLRAGADVSIVNRKRLLHAKCYGSTTTNGDSLIVSSGNFTGPGMSLNVEASLFVPDQQLRGMGFSWPTVVSNILGQAWDIHHPTLTSTSAPAWKLLYDEFDRALVLDESEETTLLVLLGHNDTARIQAGAGTTAGLGSQYFWLSRDSYGFFPPLTTRNVRGVKATFSTLINMKYIDLGGKVDRECRVTFEAENNLDFRLGTGMLRYSKLAKPGDIGAISRIGEMDYELRIIRMGTPQHATLSPHLVSMIGHQGKRYGYIDNDVFSGVVGVQVGVKRLKIPIPAKAPDPT